jgi:hypothetical protein
MRRIGPIVRARAGGTAMEHRPRGAPVPTGSANRQGVLRVLLSRSGAQLKRRAAQAAGDSVLYLDRRLPLVDGARAMLRKAFPATGPSYSVNWRCTAWLCCWRPVSG